MEEKRLRAEFQMNLSRESPHGGQCYRGPGGAPDLLLSLGVREAFAPADFRAVLARVAEDRNAIDRPLSEPQLELCVALVRPGACFPTVAVDGGRSPPSESGRWDTVWGGRKAAPWGRGILEQKNIGDCF